MGSLGGLRFPRIAGPAHKLAAATFLPGCRCLYVVIILDNTLGISYVYYLSSHNFTLVLWTADEL